MSTPIFTNVFAVEGATSAMVRASAPGNYRSSMVVVTNDGSGINMGVRLMGTSAGATGREITLAGGETFSQYFKTNAVEVSCNSVTGVGAGLGYRVWFLG